MPYQPPQMPQVSAPRAFGYQGNYQGQQSGGGNPFAITPGNNMLPGLNALGRGMETMGKQMKEKKAKEQAQAQYTDIRTRIEAASSLPDYERAQEIAKLQGEYPEVMTKFGESLVGYDDTARNLGPRKQIVGQTLQAVAQDPDNAMAYYQKAKADLAAQGVTQTPVLDSAIQEIQANPQAAGRNALTNLQLLAPDRAAAFKASQPAQKELMGKVNPDDWTPGSLAEYARTGDYGVLEAAIEPPTELDKFMAMTARQNQGIKLEKADREQVEFDQRQAEVARETESRESTELRRKLAHGSVDRAMALEGTELTVDDENYMRANIDGLPPREAHERNKEFIEAKRAGDEAAVKKEAQARDRAALPARIDKKFPNASPAQREEMQKAAADAETPQAGYEAAGVVRTQQRNDARGQALVDKTKLLVAQILTSPDWQDAVGPMEGKEAWYNVHGGGEADVVADIKEAKGLLTLPNMSLMSGVLSQSDMEFLQSISGGALERTRTDDRFRKDAMDLLKGLGTPTLNQQSEVDSLSSGTVFIYSDGLPYIKD